MHGKQRESRQPVTAKRWMNRTLIRCMDCCCALSERGDWRYSAGLRFLVWSLHLTAKGRLRGLDAQSTRNGCLWNVHQAKDGTYNAAGTTKLVPASIDSNASNQLFDIMLIAHLQGMGETALLDGLSKFLPFSAAYDKQHYTTFRSLQTGIQLCASHGKTVYLAFGGPLGVRVRGALRAPRVLLQFQSSAMQLHTMTCFRVRLASWWALLLMWGSTRSLRFQMQVVSVDIAPWRIAPRPNAG